MGSLWWIYGKYRDDLFFANAEYSRFGWDVFPSGRPHDYRKGYLLFSEVGTLLGPANASLMFALSSGHCLKESDPTERNWRHPINYQVMAPYESLMFHTFGGGNQTFYGPPADSHGLHGSFVVEF